MKPHEYVGVIKRGKELVKKVKGAMGKPDEDGFIVPIIFIKELNDFRDLVNRKIGNLDPVIDNTKNNGEYITLQNELIEIGEDIKVLQEELSKEVH